MKYLKIGVFRSFMQILGCTFYDPHHNRLLTASIDKSNKPNLNESITNKFSILARAMMIKILK